MVKVEYDIYAPPMVEKKLLLNATLYFDTTVSPIQLKGWYEPSYRIGVKFPSDCNIYLDSNLTKALFASAVSNDRPYEYMISLPMKNSFIGVWLGKTVNNYDTPVIVVINKEVSALLIYNISPNVVQVNHHADIYPNYETNGTYSAGVVTLGQGQYVLFYGSVKPTVNPSAPWGFANYEPVSSTSKPSVYVDVTDGTNHFYYESTIDLNIILRYDLGTVLAEINNIIVSYLGLRFLRDLRGGRDADHIRYLGFDQGLATPYPLRPDNIYPTSIYDYDPPSGTTWAWGLVVDNVSYIKDSDGITVVFRALKTTTNPYNPRCTYILAVKYVKEGTKVRLRVVQAYRSLTTIRSYGSPNQTHMPGFGTCWCSDPSTYEYFDGSTWWVATPGSGSYNYYNGYGVRAEVYNPLDTNVRYKFVALMRKFGRYGTAPIKVASLRNSTYTDRGLLTVFIDYAGGTIPADNYVCMIFNAIITSEATYPDISTESPTEDTDIWSYLIGYPYDISINAPSSAPPDSTVTITVVTNAPDNTKVYVVDKDTNEVLGSSTVTNGQATIQFIMPNKNLAIRVYIEGADISLG